MADTPLQVRAFRDRKQAATWLGVPVDALNPNRRRPLLLDILHAGPSRPSRPGRE